MRERGSRYTSAISEPIVVDASIAFLWFANEPDRSGGDELLESDSTLLAPDLMAVELGHPVYDCLYLALAVSHAAPIATADKRLQQAAGRIGVRVKT